METNSPSTENNFNNQAFVITDHIKKLLFETVKWSKLLAVLGFISMGFALIMLLFAIFKLGALGSSFSGVGGINALIYLVFYAVFIFIYFFPIYYLYQFSIKTKRALLNEDTEMLEWAFNFLRKHYKFIGILMLIMMVLYPLFIVFIFIFKLS